MIVRHNGPLEKEVRHKGGIEVPHAWRALHDRRHSCESFRWVDWAMQHAPKWVGVPALPRGASNLSGVEASTQRRKRRASCGHRIRFWIDHLRFRDLLWATPFPAAKGKGIGMGMGEPKVK